MNIGPQGVEQDRTCDDMGFDNVAQYSTGIGPSQTAYKSLGSGGGATGESPSPLQNAVIETSNTQAVPLGPSAHDIVERTR